jgi:protein TIF31
LHVFTNADLAEGDYKQDEKDVRELSNFLNDSVIPKVITLFKTGENVPCDNESLSHIFHSQGLNMRYLGKVAQSIEEGKLPHIRSLLERSMITRAAAKEVNELIKNIPTSKTSKFLAHILN